MLFGLIAGAAIGRVFGSRDDSSAVSIAAPLLIALSTCSVDASASSTTASSPLSGCIRAELFVGLPSSAISANGSSLTLAIVDKQSGAPVQSTFVAGPPANPLYIAPAIDNGLGKSDL